MSVPAVPDAVPPLRILSLNAAGTKGTGRLEQMLAATAQQRPDVMLLQEHGLHACDEARLLRTAHALGYVAVASYCPDIETRGGTAVLARRATFGLRPYEDLPRNKQHIGGRVTVAHIPPGRKGGRVELAVQNGTGVAGDDLPDRFEPRCRGIPALVRRPGPGVGPRVSP